MIAIETYCETEQVPIGQSRTYKRNLKKFGKEVADFYTYEIEGDMGDP